MLRLTNIQMLDYTYLRIQLGFFVKENLNLCFQKIKETTKENRFGGILR